MKRWKNSSFGLCADPDGVWVRYEDHVEAMKRIAGDSLLAASESLAAPKARCHPAIECCGKEPCELATPPCASVVRKTFEFYAVTKQQPEPVALHQWRYFGNAAWLDASAEEIATRKASNVATDMEFRIVYAAPAPVASPEKRCTCGGGALKGSHSRTCLAFDESMMTYEPFGKPSASPAAPDIPAGCEMTRNWCVSVECEGDRVLTISSEHVAGLHDLDTWASTIRGCANHLLSFIGEGASPAGLTGDDHE